MGFASRKSQNELSPISSDFAGRPLRESRAPSSGVRPRVLPVEAEAANDSELAPESLALLPVVTPRDVDFDDAHELQLEDAVPLSTDAALVVVLGFVVVAAGSLVAAFSVL
jgi:hypothetical protein